jgi:hypothetical protein
MTIPSSVASAQASKPVWLCVYGLKADAESPVVTDAVTIAVIANTPATVRRPLLDRIATTFPHRAERPPPAPSSLAATVAEVN